MCLIWQAGKWQLIPWKPAKKTMLNTVWLNKGLVQYSNGHKSRCISVVIRGVLITRTRPNRQRINKKLSFSLFNTKDHGQIYWLHFNYTDYIVNQRVNKLLLPQNLYSGAKHIPLFLQRPFHFRVCLIVLWLFLVWKQTQYKHQNHLNKSGPFLETA